MHRKSKNILDKIAANTDFIGKKIIDLTSCHSTNDFALTLPDIFGSGTVIVAEEQTKGRGRQGKSWESNPGENLTFSLLLRFEKNPLEELFDFSVATALAICDALRDFLPEEEFFIKWPNDVYVRDKKIAGILIENVWQGKSLHKTVIGVGLNVNQEFFENARAISMYNCVKKHIDRDSVLMQFCVYFDMIYKRMLTGFAFAERNRFKNMFYEKNKPRKFDFQGEILHAKIVGMYDDGRILLEIGNENRVTAFSLNEISWIFD